MDSPQRIPAWFLILHVVLVAGAFLLGSMFQRTPFGSGVTAEAEALELAYQFALERHIVEPDPSELLEGAIEGMIDSLGDRYSRYVRPEAAPAEDTGLTGRYEGVGIEWLPSADPPVVLFPLLGSPADAAGVLPGDRIVAVDGMWVADIEPDDRRVQLANRVRGPEGTTVTLGIERNGERLDLDVTRAAVQSRSIEWAGLIPSADNLGYLQLKEFQDETTEEMESAIDALVAAALHMDPAGLRGLVIDLRYNGGGQLSEAVGVCRLLLQDGVIVTTRDRDGEVVNRYEAEPTACRYPDLPLVILVNEQSASASEVVAGCLKDNGRARLVGNRTYGKGLVQTVFRWQDRPFRLVLTTSHYYTPSGVCIERNLRPADMPDGEHGVAPDLDIELLREQAETVQSVLLGAGQPPIHHGDRYAALCEELDRVSGPLLPENDPQLAVALRELENLATKR